MKETVCDDKIACGNRQKWQPLVEEELLRGSWDLQRAPILGFDAFCYDSQRPESTIEAYGGLYVVRSQTVDAQRCPVTVKFRPYLTLPCHLREGKLHI